MIVSSAFVAAITMYFNQIKISEGERAAFRRVNGLLLMAGVVGLLLGLAIFFTSNMMIKILAPGLTVNASNKAIHCLEITSLSLPFLLVYSLLIGLLNAKHIFVITALSSILLVGLIPVPVLFGFSVTSESLAWGFDAGALGACTLLLAFGRHIGFLSGIRISWSDLTHAVSISAPAMAAATCAHLLWLSERYFASSLEPGTISALNYGQRITNFIAGGLTFATSTVLLPYLSAWIEAGERKQAAGFNRKAIVGTTICAIVGVLVLLTGGEWLVRLAYGRGQFDEAAISLTTTAVWLYLGLFVAYLYGIIISPNAMAMNEKTLVVAPSAIALISYLILAPILTRAFGFNGLPLSASIAFLLGLILAAIGMWRKYPDFYWAPLRWKFRNSVSSFL
jgi:putative peptidoglycan lipid II flippase